MGEIKTAVKVECPYCNRKVMVSKMSGLLRRHQKPVDKKFTEDSQCPGSGMPAFMKQDRFSGREDMSKHE